MEDKVETSTRAPLNARVGYTFNLKGSNWISVPEERTLTPNVPVHPYALVFLSGT